ncbi:MAG: oligosaccharide flippase family protein [Bacteroidales bacterium]|jgi:O-antigen/teichoic acid export membrane protein|nr:oligosaccharide flippase family protein [Bacteroidales bacterium]
MRRKFIIHLFLFLGFNFLVKPFWVFGIDRTVQNTVGEHAYGIYFALFNFSLIFNMLLDFGITNFNNRSVARSNDFLRESFSRIFTLKLLLGVFYIGFVLIAGYVIGYDICRYQVLIPLVVNQFLASFILYLRSSISGLLMFKTDSILSVLDRVIMIVCCGILLWGNVTDRPFQIEWFVYVQTVAYLLTVVIALFIVLRKAKLQFPSFDYGYIKYIFRQSFPFAVLTILTGLHNRIDSVFLERLLPDGTGAEQAGIYASAFRLLDAAMMVAYVFSVLLLPMFARMTAAKEAVGSLVKTSFTFIYVYGISVAICCYYYSYPLMELLYRNHILESAHVFQILMLSIAPLSATYIFGSLLTANGNLKQLNIIACIAMLLNIGLNIILIPHYRAMGSAIASICTQLFIITVEIILVIRIFSLKLSWRYVVRLCCFLVFTVIFGWMSLLLPFSSAVDCLIMVCFCGCLIFVLGLVKPKEVILLLKKDLDQR